MKPLSWFPFLFALTLVALLSGCASTRPVRVSSTPYSSVVTSDFEGRWIAEYIAEGDVKKTEDGYRFNAVQRRIFQPATLEFLYPLGRPVTVLASNVVVTPAPKPL